MKEKLKILREVKKEISNYDERAWKSLSRLLKVDCPKSNADKIVLLTKIKLDWTEINPGGFLI